MRARARLLLFVLACALHALLLLLDFRGAPPARAPLSPVPPLLAAGSFAYPPNCLHPPTSWGAPSHAASALGAEEPGYLTFLDVLPAADAVCARLTRARHRTPAARGDGDRVVLATHFSPDRFASVARAAERWGGCLSVALFACGGAAFEAVVAAWRAHPALSANATLHVVLGGGLYPNAAHDAALAPFSPWAASPPAAAPWALFLDADAIPSAGEAAFAGEVAAAVGGGGGGGGGADAAADAAWCAAWDGRPPPLQCSPIGIPSAANWAAWGSTVAWHVRASRCGRRAPPASTLFLVPSWDVARLEFAPALGVPAQRVADANAARREFAVGGLLALPGGGGGAAAAAAHAHLAAAVREGAAEVQAQGYFAPGYKGLVPWGAWLAGAGPFPVHYALAFEPYFIGKAPLPSAARASAPWSPFGADRLRYTWWAKGHAVLRWWARGAQLVVLPRVFALNDHWAGSEDTAPRAAWEEARKATQHAVLVAAVEELGLHCADLCPCVEQARVNVMPEQGFHILSGPQP